MRKEAPRILINRLSAIGDAILTLPVACAIRRHLPDAYIGWVVERKAAPMVQGHEDLDAVIVLERAWFTSPIHSTVDIDTSDRKKKCQRLSVVLYLGCDVSQDTYFVVS